MKKLSLLLIAFMCLGLTMNAQEISEDFFSERMQKHSDLEMLHEKQLKSSTKAKNSPKVAMNETTKLL